MAGPIGRPGSLQLVSRQLHSSRPMRPPEPPQSPPHRTCAGVHAAAALDHLRALLLLEKVEGAGGGRGLRARLGAAADALGARLAAEGCRGTGQEACGGSKAVEKLWGKARKRLMWPALHSRFTSLPLLQFRVVQCSRLCKGAACKWPDPRVLDAWGGFADSGSLLCLLYARPLTEEAPGLLAILSTHRNRQAPAASGAAEQAQVRCRWVAWRPGEAAGYRAGAADAALWLAGMGGRRVRAAWRAARNCLHWLWPSARVGVQPNLTSWQGSQASTGQRCGCAARCPAAGWCSTAAALRLILTGRPAVCTLCWVLLAPVAMAGPPTAPLCGCLVLQWSRKVPMVQLLPVWPRALC